MGRRRQVFRDGVKHRDEEPSGSYTGLKGEYNWVSLKSMSMYTADQLRRYAS